MTNGAKDLFVETDGWVCAGTSILTACGAFPAETLRAGDRVVTIREAGPPLLPVVRTLQRSVDLTCHPAPAAARPICVHAHAFAPGIPAHDIWLSPNQLVYVDGAFLVLADLCNGSSIHPDPAIPQATYIRLELPAHDVILADGLPLASAVPMARRLIPLQLRFAAPAADGLCLALARQGPALEEARAMLAYRARPPLHHTPALPRARASGSRDGAG